MLALEHRIAEPKHHRRVYEELCAVWTEVLGACDGSWHTPDPSRIEAMVAAVWGARRYLLLVKPRGFDQVKWAEQMEQIVWAALGGAASDAYTRGASDAAAKQQNKQGATHAICPDMIEA